MATAAPYVLRTYLQLLEQAIVRLRFRLRMGEEVSADELHTGWTHYIPHMLRNYGDREWFVEENIDGDLARYDEKWLRAIVKCCG